MQCSRKIKEVVIMIEVNKYCKMNFYAFKQDNKKKFDGDRKLDVDIVDSNGKTKE